MERENNQEFFLESTKPISGELLRLKEEILKYALDYGLDFYDVIFEVCDYETINVLAAHGGFPNRYPHWRFGMEYDQLYKGYAYGLQKIYEMVVNTNPCYAYLLNVNNIVDQKIVMAHVYGHADFFKNNYWFASSDRNMMDVMANHGTKIRRYSDRYGQDKVEEFIDRVLSLENLLDVNILFERGLGKKGNRNNKNGDKEKDLEGERQDEGMSSALKSFMSSKDRDDRRKKDASKPKEDEAPPKISEKIEKNYRDIMLFLLENAPIEEWQADIIGILREEAYYYLPQRLTKIMNEGWASYWHSTIMTQKALRSSEIVDFADHHAGVMAMSRKQLNPYKIGLELFRDIEYRWNSGRFGKEYNDCTDMRMLEEWDKKLGLGREKIFEVRKSHNDITFIDEFFTKDFCERQKIFTYTFNPNTGRNEITSRDFEVIKAKLLSQLTNYGTPVIEIEKANFANRGELLLRHKHNGVELDLQMASETMKNIFFIWKRPINLVTISEGREAYFVHDGKEFKTLKM